MEELTNALRELMEECRGCKHAKDHIAMIGAESEEPCKYCSRHYFDKYEAVGKSTEVSRCKDCKHCISYVPHDSFDRAYKCQHFLCKVEAEGFCAWGSAI